MPDDAYVGVYSNRTDTRRALARTEKQSNACHLVGWRNAPRPRRLIPPSIRYALHMVQVRKGCPVINRLGRAICWLAIACRIMLLNHREHDLMSHVDRVYFVDPATRQGGPRLQRPGSLFKGCSTRTSRRLG